MEQLVELAFSQKSLNKSKMDSLAMGFKGKKPTGETLKTKFTDCIRRSNCE